MGKTLDLLLDLLVVIASEVRDLVRSSRWIQAGIMLSCLIPTAPGVGGTEPEHDDLFPCFVTTSKLIKGSSCLAAAAVAAAAAAAAAGLAN